MKRKMEWARGTRNSCYQNPEQSAAAGRATPPPPSTLFLSPHLFSFRLRANVQVSHASASWAPCELRFCPVAAETSHFAAKQKGYTQKTNEKKVNVFQTPYLHWKTTCHLVDTAPLWDWTPTSTRQPGSPRLLKLCAPRELMQWLFSLASGP